MTLSIIAVRLLYVLVLIFYYLIPVQALHSAEYYKCLDGKGKIYFSNVACPSQSQKSGSKQFRETTEQEYQQAERQDEANKQREKARREAEAQSEKARERERLLNECLNEADERYQTRWDETCLFGGGAKGCLLNSEIAAGYDRSHRGERNECYRRYPPGN